MELEGKRGETRQSVADDSVTVVWDIVLLGKQCLVSGVSTARTAYLLLDCRTLTTKVPCCFETSGTNETASHSRDTSAPIQCNTVGK